MQGWIRRAAAGLIFAFAATAAGTALADYPDKPVRLVVPFPPGGATDLLAREIGNALSARLPAGGDRQPARRGGNLAAIAVARAPADGYTLLFGTFGSLAVNKSLYDKPGYDPLKDFAPVASVAYLPTCWWCIPACRRAMCRSCWRWRARSRAS